MEVEINKRAIDSHIAHLNATLSNFKKAPNRKYKRNTLTTKLRDARATYTEITNLLAEYESKYSKV